jgi:tetratricopeptide (TPR) repeat protein
MPGSEAAILRNRYRVLGQLGAGGGGTVYEVEDLLAGEQQGRRLALKAVFLERDDDAVLDLLRHEFRALAVLRHPLLARVHDFGRLPALSTLPGATARSGYFLTRDMIGGTDLYTHCLELEPPAICGICRQVAEVLEVLHRSGLVHGDLKPANVIVSADGRPHLIDFGLVRVEGYSFGSSGTLPYLAPEILGGRGDDRRADLYALGITLYRLLTKRLPLRNATTERLVEWHRRRGPLRLPDTETPGLERIVQRLTSPDPDQRFPTAAEAALALSEIAAPTGVARPQSRPFIAPAPEGSITAPLVSLEALVRRRLLHRAEGPTLVALQGDVGMGKSTLLRELAWRCQLDGVEVVRGEFRASDLRAYAPWPDILTQIAGATAIPHPLERQAPQLAAPFGLFQAIGDYLESSAACVPLLVLLEGGEQADGESRAMLRFISHAVQPTSAVMIVVALRSDDGLLRDLDLPTCIQLEPLSASDVRHMVEGSSGRDDDDLAAQLHALTGGNPMFVVAALEQLARQGWPPRPELDRILPPLGLEDLCTRRFRALPPQEQALLEALAVIGRPTSEPLLASLAPDVGDAGSPLASILERLREDEWIDHGAGRTWRFHEGHGAQMLYQQIPPHRRQALHLAVTRALERSGSLDAVEWTLHSIGAGRADLALTTLDRAIAKLREVGASRSAIRLLDTLLPLVEPVPDDARRVRRELAPLCLSTGDYARAKRELSLLLLDAAPSEQQALSVSLARAMRLSGEAQRAAAVLQPILGEAPPAARVAALAELAEVQLSVDQHAQVLQTARQALELVEAERQPSLGMRAEILGQVALALGFLDRGAEADDTWKRALSDARRSGDLRVQTNVLNRAAVSAFRQSNFAVASQCYMEALECADRVGDVERVAAIRCNLASVHVFVGALASALDHLPKSVRQFETIGMQRGVASGRANLGLLQLRLGLYEQARATLERACEAARAAGYRGSLALALSLLAQVEAARGRIVEAREQLARARTIYAELGQLDAVADTVLDGAEIELSAGELSRAERAIGEAVEGRQGELRPDLVVRVVALRARVAARSGRGLVPATAALLEAMPRAKGLGSPELVWQCHAAAMEAADAQGEGEAARGHAEAAMRVLRHMAADLPADVRLAFWQVPLRLAVHRRAVGALNESQLADETIDAAGDPCDEPDTRLDLRTEPPTTSTLLDLPSRK